MSDNNFIKRLKEEPCAINRKEFEEKALLGYIKIENYDLLIKQKLSMTILQAIVEMQPLLSRVQDLTILTADLSDTGNQSIVGTIERMYQSLCSVNGLSSAGASKILHLLNNKLFPVIIHRITD